MEAVITLNRDAVEQAVKEYIERQGYVFVKLVPPEREPMRMLSDPGSIGVVVTPRPEKIRSQYDQP